MCCVWRSENSLWKKWGKTGPEQRWISYAKPRSLMFTLTWNAVYEPDPPTYVFGLNNTVFTKETWVSIKNQNHIDSKILSLQMRKLMHGVLPFAQLVTRQSQNFNPDTLAAEMLSLITTLGSRYLRFEMHGMECPGRAGNDWPWHIKEKLVLVMWWTSVSFPLVLLFCGL